LVSALWDFLCLQKKMKMKGDLVKYTQSYDQYENLAIVIDYKPGYSLRKSWSDRIDAVHEPLIRVYWLQKPREYPQRVCESLVDLWKMSNQTDLFEPNTIIEEWHEIVQHDWFFASSFEIVEKIEFS